MPTAIDTLGIELLQRMPIFGAIDEAALRFLLSRARQATRAAGEHFFLEGDEAQSMFVLATGRVSVTKRWQGRDYMLRPLGPGDCFGEMALMDMHPRSASVRADAGCHALELGTDDLLALYERDAAQFALIQMNMGREVCRRLRELDEMLFRAQMNGELPAGPQVFPAV
jgi:CRP/FNR family transcriptional regulator, cyclic AMP receptor protein